MIPRYSQGETFQPDKIEVWSFLFHERLQMIFSKPTKVLINSITREILMDPCLRFSVFLNSYDKRVWNVNPLLSMELTIPFSY